MSLPKDRPEIGQQVSSTHMFIRTRDSAKVVWRGIKQPTPIEGVYVGYRIKQNGRTLYRDRSAEWQCDSTQAVALVVVSERKKPVLVPFDTLVETHLGFHENHGRYASA